MLKKFENLSRLCMNWHAYKNHTSQLVIKVFTKTFIYY